jgi:uncharacterized protein with gpF-like domain
VTEGDAVARVRRAVAAGDGAALRPALHPYLHWTRADGERIRGRTRVLALLAGREMLAPPVSHELRDGQVYRWVEPSGAAEGG